MPRSRMYGVKWHECVKCGVTFPEGQVNQNAKGEWVCVKCWDENEGETS